MAKRDGPEIIEKIKASIKKWRKSPFIRMFNIEDPRSCLTWNIGFSGLISRDDYLHDPLSTFILHYCTLIPHISSCSKSEWKNLNGSHFLGDALSNIKFSFEKPILLTFFKKSRVLDRNWSYKILPFSSLVHGPFGHLGAGILLVFNLVLYR